ncbi:Dihydrolipoyllysine-residue acetyltransferase component of pyruvate dehydrogenase complex,partial [Buchnera aphidicola (Periphyllus testudinaceus)]|uniref:2-oxo acid dehydrogenase subunit E2 n=1 Tax=Buchnera aphidicola TaxID=9 RepID=UPI003463F693
MSMIIKVPDIGIDEAEVIEILIKPLDKLRIDQGLIIVEGQKASIEIPCTKEGIVKNIYVKVGDIVKINSPILSLSQKNSKSKINLENKSSSFLKNTDKNSEIILNLNKNKNNNSKIELIHSSPSVKRLCRKFKISIEKIKGTGRKSRILKEDVIHYINSLKDNTEKKLKSKKYLKLISKEKELNVSNNFKKIVFLSKVQNISSKIFSKNWIEIPHVTQFAEIDITKLENFRIKINKSYLNLNIKFTLLTFIIKAISLNLLKFKKFNSILHRKKDRIILKKDINIGVAVNTKDGVFVPVIKNVNHKTIKNISDELLDLSKKSRKNKLTFNEINKGSFTVSNLGNFDVREFTPIINSPEVAILGVSRAKMKPIWKNNNFVPRLLLPLSLSYDHRIINGVDGALFIKNLNKNLKNFYRLLF